MRPPRGFLTRSHCSRGGSYLNAAVHVTVALGGAVIALKSDHPDSGLFGVLLIFFSVLRILIRLADLHDELERRASRIEALERQNPCAPPALSPSPPPVR